MSAIADIPGRNDMLVRTPRDIGLRIRDRRKTLGWSQAALADHVGVTRQWIVDMERGKSSVALSLVLRTLTAVGLNIDLEEDKMADENEPRTLAPVIDLDKIIEANRTPLPSKSSGRRR